jgi:hypothetical protein
VPEAKDCTASREVVEVCRQASGEDWRSVSRTEDDRPETHPRGLDREDAKMQPGVRRIRWMVTDEERVEPEIVGEASGGQHAGCGIWVGR